MQVKKEFGMKGREGGGISGRENDFAFCKFIEPCQAAHLFSLLNIFLASAFKKCDLAR